MVKKRKEHDDERVRMITTGSNIRFEPVNSSRTKSSKPKVVVSVAQEINPVSNFLDFLKQHAVVGLIIGFVLGNQVQSLVKQVVQSFLDPLTQLLFGTAISQKTFTMHFNGRQANFGWGALVYALVIFMLVLLTMYLVLRILKLDKLEKSSNVEAA
ncbi:MAG TPA: MscL family protein [Patescibacteria group bacterium]|nr:MscL family protein [Patescibacteria group bacterium]